MENVRQVACVFIILCYSYMMFAVLIGICGRYIFNYSIAGTEETAIFAQIWLALVGGGYAMRCGTHVAVDVLAARLQLLFARIVSVLIVVGSVWFLGVVFVGSLTLIEIGFIQTSPAWLIPMWIIYLMMPVGATYFGVEVILALVDNWDQPFGMRLQQADSD